MIIKSNSFEKARKEINEAKKSQTEIIFSSENDELTRKVIEKLPIDILLINLSDKKDFQKQRNSGFNQVLSKIAKKNNITLGINLDEIINSKNKKEKSEIIARIKQNIRICKKDKLKIKFVGKTQKTQKDLQALALVLGMDTKTAKNSA